MTPSADLLAARRQALITLTDADALPGQLRLRDAGGVTLVAIVLQKPCGAVDATGVSLTTTDYGQIVGSGPVVSARLVNGAGVLVSDFTAGLAIDDPVPDVILPFVNLYAGAFMRLTGAHIEC